MRLLLIAAVAVLLAAATSLDDVTTIQGSLTIVDVNRFQDPNGYSVIFHFYINQLDQNGKPVPITKDDMFNNGGNKLVWTFPIKVVGTHKYTAAIPSGSFYSIFSFADINGNGALDLNEPLGWYSTEYSAWMSPLFANASGVIQNVNINLSASHPFNYTEVADLERKYKTLSHLEVSKGLNILKLKGNIESRAYEHGLLAAPQIIDWFRFYVLEQSIGSAALYTSKYEPWLKSNFASNELLRLAQRMLSGMIQNGCGIWIPELNRNMAAVDILAINAYIELGSEAACSQFSAWGPQTADGQTIAARNMDGEVDVRKVTVSHLTLFSHQPTLLERSSGLKKYVSLMWPGFLGTLTSVNEDGLYAMMNTGRTAKTSAVTNLVPVSWSLNYIISTFNASAATPAAVEAALLKFKSSGGGISDSGCVFHFARPNTPDINGPPGYIYEADRFGGYMRTPGQVVPLQNHSVMATNHFLVYGVDKFTPDLNFGEEISFSSKYRYFTGQSWIQSRFRQQMPLGEHVAHEFLQRVSSGYTEHSVFFTPHNKVLHIANADLLPNLWDAPYRKFERFEFDEFF